MYPSSTRCSPNILSIAEALEPADPLTVMIDGGGDSPRRDYEELIEPRAGGPT
jgi:hypothetical protein